MYKIANEPPVDILTVNPGVPECLASIIDRALAKDKSRRFATGEEMAEALRACGSLFATGDLDVRL
jgi:serine/threonine-protein kinase